MLRQLHASSLRHCPGLCRCSVTTGARRKKKSLSSPLQKVNSAAPSSVQAALPPVCKTEEKPLLPVDLRTPQSLHPSPFDIFRASKRKPESLLSGKDNTAAAAPESRSILRSVESWMQPARLQQRIRSLLVQLVLLSYEPLTPRDLVVAFEEVVDATTRHQYTSASYAVRLSEDGENSIPVATNLMEEEAACLRGIGQQYSMLYQTSIVNAIRVVASSSPSPALAPDNTVPPVTAVHRWMIYGILLSDPYFRISLYGGYVCYPTQPSTLLSSVDLSQNTVFLRNCLRILAAENRDEVYATISEAPPSPSSAAEDIAADDTADFVWLKMAPHRRPRWTYAHSLTYALSSFSQNRSKPRSQDGGEAPPTTRSGRSSTGSSTSSHSSGHPLVDVWIQSMGANRPDSLGSCLSESILMTPSKEQHPRPPSSSTAASPSLCALPLTWNEGQRGSPMLVTWNAEGLASSEFVGCVMATSLRHTSSGEGLYRINSKVIRALLSSVVCAPISSARLSTLVRWNVSVSWASMYRSFFYVMLLSVLNSRAKRLFEAEEERERIMLNRNFSPRSSSPTSTALQPWAEKYLAAEAEAVQLMRDGVAALRKSDSSRATQQRQTTLKRRGRDGLQELTAVWQGINTPKAVGNLCNTTVSALCFRVLPHIRPSRRAKSKTPEEELCRSDYRGLPLRYVEVLPTWRQSPEETMHYLLSRREGHEGHQRQSGDLDANASDDAALWLEEEEAYLMIIPLNDTIFYRRLMRVSVEWQEAKAPQKAKPATSPSIRLATRVVTITIGELCKLQLWTHEYGVAMAAEMMLVYLLQYRYRVTVAPPSSFSVSRGATGKGNDCVDYSKWTVTFWNE